MNTRLRTLLFVAATLSIVAVSFGDLISRSLTTTLLLQQDAPDPVATQDLFTSTPNPSPIIRKFWYSQKIPHRYLAVAFIKDRLTSKEALIQGMDTLASHRQS